MNRDLARRLRPFKELKPKERKFWTLLIEKLSREVNVGPIDFEFRPIDSWDDDTAYVDFDMERFTVVLDDRMPFGMVIDYLIHELAHVGTWFVRESEPHGPHFGVEYARLYRRYLNIYEGYWNG